MMIIPDAIITINHIFTPVLANFLPDFMSLMTDETAGTAGGGLLVASTARFAAE